MAIEIDKLQIEIGAISDNAVEGLNSLLDKLNQIKTAVKGGLGLGKVSTAINNLAKGLTTLQGIDINGIGARLQSIVDTVSSINVDTSKIRQLADVPNAVKGLADLGIEKADTGFSSVAQKVEEVAKPVSSLSRYFGDLRSAMGLASSGASSLGDAIARIGTKVSAGMQIQTLQKNLQSLSKDLAGNVGKTIKSFFKSILRITLYRAIRSALKKVTQSLKEGIQNAYQFSKAMEGVFAAQMDEAKTSFDYLKNSIGAVGVQLLQTFLPAIVQIVDKIAQFSNRLAELIAAGAGRNTFIRATKSATEYAKAVNEAKSAVLSFDELNIIQKDSNVLDMFEEVEVSEEARQQAQELKDKIKEWTAIITPALLIVGTGVLLLGATALGFSLMAAGLATYGIGAYISGDGNAIDRVKASVAEVMAIATNVFFAAGALLLFSGNIAVGAGLILAGVGTLIGTVKITEGDISNEIKQKVRAILGIGGAALFAIGAVLCLTGAAIGLGIAMIVAGATAMGVSAFAINSNPLITAMRSSAQTARSIWENEFLTPIQKGVLAIFQGFSGNNSFSDKFYDALGNISPKLSDGIYNLFHKDGGEVQENIVVSPEPITPDAGYQTDQYYSYEYPNGSSELGEAVDTLRGLLDNWQGTNQGGNNQQDQNINIVVELDGTQLASTVKRIEHQAGVQIGTNGLYYSV